MVSYTTIAGPTGRFLTVPIPAPPPPARVPAPSPAAPSLRASSHYPDDDYIPIIIPPPPPPPSQPPVPKFGKIPAKTPILVIVPPPAPSDGDGLTPVTPSPSPRSKRFKRIRASQLPRDALGIAVAGFTRKKSQRAVGGGYGDNDGDYDDDTEPLSPPYDGRAADAQLGVAKAKSVRKTILGVLEGWWDLNLLEKSKSLRRK